MKLWPAVCVVSRVIMAPIIVLASVFWYATLAIAFSPRVWITLGVLLLVSYSAWANTTATSTLPMDTAIDLIVGWMTGKFAWGVGMLIIMGSAWRMYSQWGHGHGGEFYGLLFAIIIVAIMLNADLVMATLGAAAELPPEIIDVIGD